MYQMKAISRYRQKLLLIAALLCACRAGFAQNYQVDDTHGADDIFQVTFEPGETYYVFSAMANVREAPGTEAAVADVLRAGDPVKVHNVTGQSLFAQGIKAVWLKIGYTKNGMEKTGYIWQGLLSRQSFADGDTRFVYGIEKKYTENELNDAKWMIAIKAVQKGKVVATAKWCDNTSYSITMDKTDGGGLQNISTILHVAYGGGSCGIPSYTCYFAWNGKDFYAFPKIEHVADAEYSSWTEWILPNNTGGQQGVLRKKAVQMEGQVADYYGNYYTFENQTLVAYSWNGKKLGRAVTLIAGDKPALVGRIGRYAKKVYEKPDKNSTVKTILDIGSTFNIDPKFVDDDRVQVKDGWLQVYYDQEATKAKTGWMYVAEN